jgi:arylsulfatase A-like enzyme
MKLQKAALAIGSVATLALIIGVLGLKIDPIIKKGAGKKAPDTRPNIVLIMADDMGFSDVGAFGGEIPTPNIDAIASNGIRFTQFYNTSRCCPTRASLLTGLYSHQAGIGEMSEDPFGNASDDPYHWGTAAYQGFLSNNSRTIPELLKPVGYHTYMAGKWHLGMHGQEKWPLQRGFEKYYGILAGAASYLRPAPPRGLTFMNTQLEAPDTAYYTTNAFTTNAINFVREQKDNNPFFLYLAFNAPHWPLQALPEDIALFKDKYKVGWDVIRQARFDKQVKQGLWDKDYKLSHRDERVRPWDKLTPQEQEKVSYRMAVYAAMVYRMDQNIGRLINTLKKSGKYENTIFIFLSDNGACAEAYDELGSREEALMNNPQYSSVSYGMGWANTSNTPFRKWKNRPEEGGMTAPFMISWPAKAGKTYQAGTYNRTMCHLIDIMPTFLEVTGAKYPATFNGLPVPPMQGRSILPLLASKPISTHPYLFWEHENNCAVRKGDWKATKAIKDPQWQLYNLATDRGEEHNVAQENPEIVKDMDAHWQEWAAKYKVLEKRKKT